MKKTALVLAVFAVLVSMVGVPAFAGSVITNTSTAGSAAFGFEPTAANLATFTNRNTGTGSGIFLGNAAATFTAVLADALVCTPVGNSFSCVSGPQVNGYIPRAGTMPGAYTSSPSRVVSVNPDWGCGTSASTGGNCVADGGVNIEDRVLNNNAAADGNNTAPGVGTSNAATSCGIAGGCSSEGTLIGTMTSVVALDSTGDDGMPSGSITFTRTPNASTACRGTFAGNATLGCSDVTLSDSINQTVAGLYTFGHTDVSDLPFNSVASRSYGNVNGWTGTTSNIGPSIRLRSITTVTQEAMGGDPESTGGSDTQTWGTMWTNTGSHPGGNFFAPGLNNANSALDNSAILTTPNAANPVDGAGFRQ